MRYKFYLKFKYGENDTHQLKAFIDALENLEDLKKECEGKVEYFWGMRKNWFPLVLLRAGKVGNEQALAMFNQMVQERRAHNIYYKGHEWDWVDPNCIFNEKKEDVIIFTAEGNDLPYVYAILNFFGFSYYQFKNVK